MTLDTALVAFITAAQGIVDQERNARYPNLSRRVLSVERGRRYARIVVSDGRPLDRSVYCFVDMTDGTVLKAESWKKPSPIPRGNIYTDEASKAVDAYGAHYMR